MRKILPTTLFALLLPAVSYAADKPVATTAYAADKSAATVNAQPVKQSWLDLARKDAQESGKTLDEQALLANFIRNELLSQESIRLGIDKQPGIAAREEIRRREMLAGLLINDHLKKNPITEDMLKAEYKNFKTQLGGKEYSARHIQFKTEDEAKDAIAQLAKGVDFARLAKEKSMDESSKDKGGLLDWVAPSALKPPLGEALSGLQKGLFTTVPLRTNDGWHVLKLEAVRDLQAPDYDKVKEQLRQRLRTQQIGKLVDSLRAQAKIEIAK